MTFLEVIRDQTQRSIWSLKNIINCVPEEYWYKEYCEMSFWKHTYHTIHSLDRWYINPERYEEPDIHIENLNNLDVRTDGILSRVDIDNYLQSVSEKITDYISTLTDEKLSAKPEGCDYSRLHLILAQHRHLDMHIGMMMGFIIADTGKWPRVMGLQSEFQDNQSSFF